MRRGGRVRCSIYARFLFFCAGIVIASCTEYGVPIEIKYWDTGRSPLSHMVDVTNGFALKVLAEHNFLNDNNIAFSPYGLMGIMVALYEGVDGDSSYQIQRAMQMPWNRNVMRIGFRDIHRTLKTYFVPEEGFLAGLALNNENVTFNENYKKVLRFYGFDLESEQTTTTSPDIVNSTSTSTTSTNFLESKVPTSVMTTLNVENIATTVKEESSTNPSVTTDVMQESTTSSLGTTTPASSTTETTTTLNNLLESTTTTTEVSVEATMASSTVPVTSTTLEPLSTTVTTTLNTDVEILTDLTSITTEQTPATTSSLTTDASTITTESTITTITQDSEGTTIMTTSLGTKATTENIETSTMTSESSIESASTILTTDTITPTSENPTPSTESSMLTTENTTNNAESVPNQTLAAINESSLETLERRKKSIVDFIFTNPPYIDDYMLFRSYDIGPNLPNTGYEFLVNGLKNTQVTYMNYDTVLEHAYLPHLEASALKLPLDSDRYYLLVVLPNRRRAGELERLLTRMARESDLSDVYAALRLRRVRALVPSFVVKGHVTLTTDLQKIGIRDVFEPRQSDFTPMTCQVGVYVRSIEQAVSVAIRKYQADDTKMNRYVTNRRRIYFSATYPFLYFVMDANIHVALMAGKMVDPLNTRIL